MFFDQKEPSKERPVITIQPPKEALVPLVTSPKKPGAKPAAPSVPLASLTPACQKVMVMEQPGPLKSLSELKTRFLESHNEIRKIYSLPELKWSEELASYAQEWANYLRDNKQCKMHHRSALGMRQGKKYGENLAWNWHSITEPEGRFISSPEQATLDWSKECEDYSYESNSCAQYKQCGHFTQVVWRDTKLVGCAIATCDERDKNIKEGHSEVWVCNYSPPGNMTNIYPDGRKEEQKPF